MTFHKFDDGDAAGKIREYYRCLEAAHRYSFREFMDAFMRMMQPPSLSPEMLQGVPGLARLLNSEEMLRQRERDRRRCLGMFDAMTPRERDAPSVVDDSRAERIAGGSGTTASEVHELLHLYRAFQAWEGVKHR